MAPHHDGLGERSLRAKADSAQEVAARDSSSGEHHVARRQILHRELGVRGIDGSRVHVVPVAHVDYIESEDDYVRIHSRGQELRKKQPLSELEALLRHQERQRHH